MKTAEEPKRRETGLTVLKAAGQHQKKWALSTLLLALALLLSACATTEGGSILRGTMRKAHTPGSIQYEMKLSAGRNGDYSNYEISGAVTYSHDQPVIYMVLNVLADDEQTQQIEYYLERNGQDVRIYEYISGEWTLKELNRIEAQHFYTGLEHQRSVDLVKAMRASSLDGEQNQAGILCSLVSGEVPMLQLETIFGDTLLPDFFGINADETALYDDIGAIWGTAYVGVEDDLLYRLKLKLDGAVLPMVALTIDRKVNSGSASSRNMWEGLNLAYCQLDIRYYGYDERLNFGVPAEVVAAATEASLKEVELDNTQTSDAPSTDASP